MMNFRFLIKTIKSDYRINSRTSFLVLLFYRIQNYFHKRNMGILRKIMGGAESIFFFLLRVDAQISYKAILGNNIRFPHRAMGVVISPRAIVGNNVTIFHQVTIGVNENQKHKRLEIGNNCYLSAGCKVISCIVSENCKIAPNAVVYKNIPPNSLVFAVNDIRSIKEL